jgi:long-chain acyl-CoA synthetase
MTTTKTTSAATGSDAAVHPWFASYDANTPRTLSYSSAPLHHLLRDTAREFPNKVATRFVLRYMLGERMTIGGTLTYAQLQRKVAQFAAALANMGVKKGDRVALMLPNSPHFVIAFFGAVSLGAIVVNTNPTYTPRELKHQLADSGAETIVLLNLFKSRLDEIISETSVRNVIVAHVYDTLKFPSKPLVRSRQRKEADWVDVRAAAGTHLFEGLLQGDGKYSEPVINPDDVALFQYTGGTTGTPKAAMLTHRNLMANVQQTVAWNTQHVRGAEKMMAAIPFFHVYGMTVCMLFGLAVGAELIIVPNPRPIENVMRIMQHERCTLYPGVPAMYIGIVNHPKLKEFDLRSIKVCISGSAPLPMEVQHKFEQLTGGRLVEGYGLTEAAPVTHCNPILGRKKEGSIGVPYPDVEAKIISTDNGATLGPDEIGELLLRAPQVMVGYWQRPEETANTVDSDGWLHTGDIARMDADGYFYIVDRKKDMINVGGLKVLPRDVEEVLYAHPKIQEAVVAGIPHPTRGDDTLKAFVVLKAGQSCSADELKDYCRTQLAPHKIPRDVQFRAELPKTQVGKVLRRVLVDEEKAKQA